MTTPQAPAEDPQTEDENQPAPPLTVEGLIHNFAQVAKDIHGTYRIPINSAVQLVSLGVQFHLATRAQPQFPGYPDLPVEGIDEPGELPEGITQLPAFDDPELPVAE